ncbi:LysE family translocator [Ectopseudomonas alcaliphila]|uniref:LysE family translocator n=1 Tax=Ectopseudomonas alcaliphila TaxID=101564 RepID=UPI00278AA40C|nr:MULTISPECIES: LysE family transporter [Pseudomonas]MDP9939200.1 hypothetical protein [Pseudomonas sp. 3400]MDR7011423.1 hypothetical protein [Pseudomonas alcaliphila]
MNQWLPFILFASVASITPGPTNLLILGSAARFGLSIALAIAVGASLGASLMLLVVGLGLGELLARAPLLQTVMAWAGAVWISWMARPRSARWQATRRCSCWCPPPACWPGACWARAVRACYDNRPGCVAARFGVAAVAVTLMAHRFAAGEWWIGEA